MSRIDNWVGTRTDKTAFVPTQYGLLLEAVKEAIVNSICHRDYTSKTNVQVMLFKDKLEIWNPGHLQQGLTIK